MQKSNTKLNGAPQKVGQFQEAWLRLRRNKLAMAGLAVIILLFLIAIFADVFFDYDTVVIEQNTAIRLQPPSAEHILGTDEFGRDILARIVHGSRVSLSVGIISVVFALLVGGAIGAVAGFVGGKVDDILMRIMDILLAIPSLLLSITIVSALGQSLFNLVLAISISFVPSFSRTVRAAVMTVKDKDFVESARCIGANNFEIILQHILPNCLATIIVDASLKIATSILTISGLSFLGLGVKAPMPEWGAMLSGGRAYMRQSLYLTLFPGLAIVITILSFNLLGDGLRDALDPKLKK